MTHSIFFDLETSDRNPIGQILNYCFFEVDENFEVVSECKGLVKISRLELPDPDAILANRISVTKHQEEASRDEAEAVKHIFDFISGVTSRQDKQTPLIGYNSLKFDIPYLRTTFIRNGVNPYFSGKIVCKDLYHAVQKAFIRSLDFSAPLLERAKAKDKLSLSLEAVSQSHGMLTGKQAHESEFDVLLTIKLAKLLTTTYAVDVRNLDACEVISFHDKGPVVLKTLQPNYEMPLNSRTSEGLLMHLTNDRRSGLWVDLNRYREGNGRQSIRWLSPTRHAIFVEGEAEITDELKQVVGKARDEFRDITLRNFFGISTCDIEQDIYRIDFDGIRQLGDAIAGDARELKRSKNRDSIILLTRSKLRGSDKLSESGWELFRRYAIHRYGGTTQLSKSPQVDGSLEFHQTLAQRMERIILLREGLKGSSEPEALESVGLLNDLGQFIVGSEIMKVAGEELLAPVGEVGAGISSVPSSPLG